jgi:hypothetical protein
MHAGVSMSVMHVKGKVVLIKHYAMKTYVGVDV